MVVGVFSNLLSTDAYFLIIILSVYIRYCRFSVKQRRAVHWR